MIEGLARPPSLNVESAPTLGSLQTSRPQSALLSNLCQVTSITEYVAVLEATCLSTACRRPQKLFFCILNPRVSMQQEVFARS